VKKVRLPTTETFCETARYIQPFNGERIDAIRDDLNATAPRAMGVLRPLKVVIENYPEDQVEQLEAQVYRFFHEAGVERVASPEPIGPLGRPRIVGIDHPTGAE